MAGALHANTEGIAESAFRAPNPAGAPAGPYTLQALQRRQGKTGAGAGGAVCVACGKGYEAGSTFCSDCGTVYLTADVHGEAGEVGEAGMGGTAMGGAGVDAGGSQPESTKPAWDDPRAFS